MDAHELIERLPSDIKRTIYIRQAKRIGLFLLWYGALAFGVWRYVEYRGVTAAPVKNIIIMIAVFGVIPFLLFRFDKLFTESTYEGKIEEIKTVGNWGGSAVVSRSDKVSNTAYARIKIRLDDGRKRVIHLVNNDGRYNEYYKASDRIRHYRYIEIPENPDRTHQDTVVCVVCGEFYDIGDEKCTKCGCTLLK